jgi:hypothetical protein
MNYTPTQPDAINAVERNPEIIASAGKIQVAVDDPDQPGKEHLYLTAETKGATDPSGLQYARTPIGAHRSRPVSTTFPDLWVAPCHALWRQYCQTVTLRVAEGRT